MSTLEAPLRDIADYGFREIVLEDDRFVLYRARAIGEETDVLLKMARAGATPDVLSEFSSDYLAARRCDIRAIPRPLHIDSTPSGVAFQIREHVPGRPLSLWVDGHLPRPSIGEALQIASLIAQALESLHARDAVHCDVSPRNLLYDAEARSVYFADCAFMRGYGAFPKSNTERNPYRAPEQGLRESKVDARADLYSVGVILYQMIVGALPPPGGDLNNGRLAAQAPGLTPLFEALLHPEVDRRYATAGALKRDLDRYLDDWRRDGALVERAPVLHEPQARMRFPDGIVGRHAIRSALYDSLMEATRGEPTLVLLTGAGGAGKTTLLEDLQRKARAGAALVLRGGWSRYDRDIPLRGLAPVSDQLVEWLSTLERRERDRIERELRHALGEGCAILTEAFPVLEQILGMHAPPPAIGTVERRNRFTHCFTSLLASVSRPEAPVVLLLEDLQWADAASLPIVERLPGRAALRNLLTVASIRTGNEGVDDAFVGELKSAAEGVGQTVRIWQVPPFDVDDTRAFLARTLGVSPARVETLAEPLLGMSLGNPLALREILASALAQGSIRFDREASSWSWSVEEIRNSHLRDDVAQILSNRLSSLPPEALSALRAAACVGRRFSLSALSELLNTPTAQLRSALEASVVEGFIVVADGGARSDGDLTYQFRHERVQSAAYAGLAQAARAKLHALRGHALFVQYDKTDSADVLFEALTHLNQGEALRGPTGLELAKLNLKAAKLAHHATAYDTAARLLQHVTSQLPVDAWQSDSALAFDVALLAAECEYLSKRTVAAERAYQDLLTRDLSVERRVTTLMMRSRMLCNMGRFEEGAKDGLACLKALGLSMPYDARPAHVVLPMLRTLAMNRHLPANPQDAQIAVLDPQTHLIMACLADLWGPAFWLSKNLTGLVVFAMVRSSLAHGNTAASAIGYASYGVFLANELKRLEFGKNVCALGVAVADRAGDPIYIGRARFMYEAFFGYLDEHVRHAPAKFRALVATSLRAGDYPYAGASANMFLYYLPVIGTPLSDFMLEAREIVSVARQTQQSRTITTVEVLRRWIQILEGRAQHTVPGFSEDNAFVEGKLNESERGLYHLFEISLFYFLEDYEAAVSHIDFLPGHQMLSGYFAIYYAFFSALIEAKRRHRPGNEKRWRQRFRACQRVIARQVEATPQNLRHMELTLQAIEAATSRAEAKAKKLFEAAIQDAREQGFLQNAAIASEWLAELLEASGDTAGAARQLRSARLWYHQWGCLVKVDALDRRGAPAQLSTSRAAPAGTTEERWPSSAASILQAARALSSETDPARLADRLVVSMVENTGASRGVLMLREEDELVVACERRAGAATNPDTRTGPRAARDLPELILNYVDRLGRPVHLIASSDNDLFGGDPYMSRNAGAAILTVPLMHMRQSLGVLFLERKGKSVGFSQVDIETAEILSAQAAATLINQREHGERLAALQDRTHPHFLFNVLTGIAELTVADPQRAESALLSLSALYRNILGSSTRAQITLKEELELAESYLNLEKLRFGDRLIHRFDIRGDASSALVPPLVIQPLLENSVNHGIALAPEGGLVSVEVTVTEHRVHVRVSDSGVGWAAGGSRRGSGHGLKSIRKRLELFFGNDAELLVNNEAGVTVDLFFPRRPSVAPLSSHRSELDRERPLGVETPAQI